MYHLPFTMYYFHLSLFIYSLKLIKLKQVSMYHFFRATLIGKKLYIVHGKWYMTRRQRTPYR